MSSDLSVVIPVHVLINDKESQQDRHIALTKCVSIRYYILPIAEIQIQR